MAYTIPAARPSTLTAGATWRWECSDDGFPPSEGWTRTASFVGVESFTLEATVVADRFRFDEAASATDRTPGRYQVIEQVAKDGDRFTVATGWVTVSPDPQNVLGDQRTHDERMLAAIEALLEGRSVDGLESYSIAGRSLQKVPMRELMQYRAIYAERVRRVQRGSGGYENVRVRFVPVA